MHTLTAHTPKKETSNAEYWEMFDNLVFTVIHLIKKCSGKYTKLSVSATLLFKGICTTYMFNSRNYINITHKHKYSNQEHLLKDNKKNGQNTRKCSVLSDLKNGRKYKTSSYFYTTH